MMTYLKRRAMSNDTKKGKARGGQAKARASEEEGPGALPIKKRSAKANRWNLRALIEWLFAIFLDRPRSLARTAVGKAHVYGLV